MKTLHAALLPALLTAASAAGVDSVWQIPRFEAAPVPDGILEETVWAEAPARELAVPLIDSAFDSSAYRTTVRLWRDDATLHVGVECRHPPGALVPGAESSPEKRVLESDSLELFLAADGGPVAAPIHHFAVNRAGARLERGGQAAEAPPWTSAVHREDGRWTAELAIPFARIGAGEPGHYWHVNVCRNLYGGRQEWAQGLALEQPGYLSPSVLLLAGPVKAALLEARVHAALAAMNPLRAYLTGPDAAAFQDLTALAERLRTGYPGGVPAEETVRVLAQVAQPDAQVAHTIILNYLFAEQP